MSSAEIPLGHIPLTRRALAKRLMASPPRGLTSELAAQLVTVQASVDATLHFELHARLGSMKAAYAPFNPDLEDDPDDLPDREVTDSAEKLADELRQVLALGSYYPVATEDIERAFREASLVKIPMKVDFEAFEELLIYARGRQLTEATVRRGPLRRRRPVPVETFDRVCIYVRFKDRSQLTPRQIKLLPATGDLTLLKLFRNIPVADLEMLFPNCEVRLQAKDKLMLGVPAVVGGVPVIVKLMPAFLSLGVLLGLSSRRSSHGVSTIAAFTALIVLGGYLWRQWSKIRQRRVEFLKLLSENLYFRNLDNNEGVLTRLVDDAEEEAAKEVMLAYAGALALGGTATREALAARVGEWLEAHLERDVNFLIERAIDRLIAMGMADRHGQDGVRVPPPDEALVRLDVRWDGFFLPGR